MKIFGINFETKKELRAKNSELIGKINKLGKALDFANDELHYMQIRFPLELGQVVYDVALKNAQGKYTKTKPSREHSTITPVEVNEKNYFGLVKRLNHNDVFFTQEAANEFLDSICK